MQRGVKALWLTTVLAATGGCVSDGGQLNVRALPDPLSAAAKKGTPMVVEARAMLALNNVGLALEAFRKAHRLQPDNIEALAGIAECYDRMGRYDLSRANYEAALAIAPNDSALLNTFAASLERQGRRAQAMALRAEASHAESAAIAAASQSLVADALRTALPSRLAQPPRPVASVTVQLPPARPAASVTVPLPAARPASAVTAQLPPPRAATPFAIPAAEVVLASPAAPRLRAIKPESLEEAATAALLAVPQPTSRPAAPVNPIRVSMQAALASQPRLQRLSTGEVALLTGTGPAWKTELVAQSPQSVTVRFVPLRTASARPNIRLLNAARRQGLAASTRAALLDRGWRKIAIGDAAQIRERSIVIYPASRKELGVKLAAQFGFRSEVSTRVEGVVVLLGRDAPARRSRG